MLCLPSEFIHFLPFVEKEMSVSLPLNRKVSLPLRRATTRSWESWISLHLPWGSSWSRKHAEKTNSSYSLVPRPHSWAWEEVGNSQSVHLRPPDAARSLNIFRTGASAMLAVFFFSGSTV